MGVDPVRVLNAPTKARRGRMVFLGQHTEADIRTSGWGWSLPRQRPSIRPVHVPVAVGRSSLHEVGVNLAMCAPWCEAWAWFGFSPLPLGCLGLFGKRCWPNDGLQDEARMAATSIRLRALFSRGCGG